MAIKDSADFDAESLTSSIDLSSYNLTTLDLRELKDLFEHATTFGSLIQVPEGLAEKLPALKQLSEATSEDLFVSEVLNRLGPLLQQTELLASQYDAVVANPPYMGSKGMNLTVKKFAKDFFPDAKSDLFACFIERGYSLAKGAGHNAMVTMQSWMFLSSFEKMRERMFQEKTIGTMAHLGARAFGSISGEVVQTAASVLKNTSFEGYKPAYFRLLDGGEEQKRTALANGENRFDTTPQNELKKIPGSPIAYWTSPQIRRIFEQAPNLGTVAKAVVGLQTGDNDRFMRQWFEVSQSRSIYYCEDRKSALASGRKWFPYNKGGEYRRWYGNRDHIVNWEEDGSEIFSFKPRSVVRNPSFYFQASITWTLLSSSYFGVRALPAGSIFDVNGMSLFSPRKDQALHLSMLSSKVATCLLRIINPTLAFQISDIQKIPVIFPADRLLSGKISSACYQTTRTDWNAYERSWDFQSLPLLTASTDPTPTLESSYTAWTRANRETIAEMQHLEEENNRLFIDAYGLADELTPDVPIEQITLTVNPAYRYGGKLTEEEQWTRFRQDTLEELVSYAIGCMMGRYSLDAPGLILADSRDNPEAHMTAYSEKVGKPMEDLKFQLDDDGIIPVLDDEWFEDDVVERFKVFLRAAFGNESLEENLRFLEEAIGKKIRKYFVNDFYKAHLQTYKKRPIYWLFQSPKKSFQALVYLHRYDRDTVNRLLNDYLRPYQDKLRNRQDHLDSMLASEATSNRDRNSATKEKEKNAQALTELADWERDVIYPLATQRLEIDLDDGVKQNYPKFGKALAKVPGLS